MDRGERGAQFLDAYDQTATTAGVTLTRKLNRQWSVSGGLTTVNEKIIQVVGVCGPDKPLSPCDPPRTTATPVDYT